jgi:hypothetical protein
MSDANDIDARKAGPEPTEAELLLIDLLYGELEGEAEAQARARVEGDEAMARELETYGELRAMLRELPDEEPPQAVSARLLHVAAETAPRKRATALALPLDDDEPGLWSRILRFFQPLVANPAVAAAAMLVLVAGVAGALYLGGNVDVAQPTAPGSPALEHAAPPAATAPQMESDESGRYRGARGATLADELNADLGIAEDQQEASGGAKQPARAEPSPRTRAKRPAEKEITRDDRDKNAFEGKPSPEPAKPTAKPPRATTDGTTSSRSGSISGKAGSGGLIDADDEASGEATASEETRTEAPAQQAPAPPPEDLKKADKSRADSPATLHQRAVLAAADGECDAVRALATQIRSADVGYYDKTIRTDKRLSSCLTVKTKK